MLGIKRKIFTGEVVIGRKTPRLMVTMPMEVMQLETKPEEVRSVEPKPVEAQHVRDTRVGVTTTQ